MRQGRMGGMGTQTARQDSTVRFWDQSPGLAIHSNNSAAFVGGKNDEGTIALERVQRFYLLAGSSKRCEVPIFFDSEWMNHHDEPMTRDKACRETSP
jgi:hypothetical protein